MLLKACRGEKERQFLEKFLNCKMYKSRFSLSCDPLCFQNSIYKSTLVRRRNFCARGLTCFELFFLANLWQVFSKSKRHTAVSIVLRMWSRVWSLHTCSVCSFLIVWDVLKENAERSEENKVSKEWSTLTLPGKWYLVSHYQEEVFQLFVEIGLDLNRAGGLEAGAAWRSDVCAHWDLLTFGEHNWFFSIWKEKKKPSKYVHFPTPTPRGL